MVVGVVSSGLDSKGPLIPPSQLPTALRLLIGGYAAFATAVLLLGSCAAIYLARRFVNLEDRASAPAVAFATVTAVCVTVGVFFFSPFWMIDRFSPALAFVVVAACALAGTIPIRTERRVSPWVYACMALVAAVPLSLEGAWRLQQRAAIVTSEPPLAGPPTPREFAKANEFGLLPVAVAPDGTLRIAAGVRVYALDSHGRARCYDSGQGGSRRFLPAGATAQYAMAQQQELVSIQPDDAPRGDRGVRPEARHDA
jgi:hypothetical protein